MSPEPLSHEFPYCRIEPVRIYIQLNEIVIKATAAATQKKKNFQVLIFMKICHSYHIYLELPSLNDLKTIEAIIESTKMNPEKT